MINWSYKRLVFLMCSAFVFICVRELVNTTVFFCHHAALWSSYLLYKWSLSAVKAFMQFARSEVNLPEECIWLVGGDVAARVGRCCRHGCDLFTKKLFTNSILPLCFTGNFKLFNVRDREMFFFASIKFITTIFFQPHVRVKQTAQWSMIRMCGIDLIY